MGMFKMPTKISFGVQALSVLETMELGNVLVVCDPFMKESKKVDLITDLLDQQKWDYSVFSEVIPDPTIDVVAAGLACAQKIQPKTFIALGGGSALDSAKSIRQMYEELTHVEHTQLICIPTTSGTGSEVTAFSVISDPENQAKYALVDDSMIPDLAILDPGFTMTVPKSITADTGMDVLTHCMEAFVSTAASDFTDACAEKAMKMVWEYLVPVVRDGEDLVGREKMHNASCLAGMAFSEASLGICHSLAHALGGRFHVPHGRANAMLLPLVISYNAGLDLANETESLKRYELIANCLGIKSGTPKATVHSLISAIYRQMKQMDMPKYINDVGVDVDEYIDAIPSMVEKALEDKCTITNPRVPTSEELTKIYMRLCRGGF